MQIFHLVVLICLSWIRTGFPRDRSPRPWESEAVVESTPLETSPSYSISKDRSWRLLGGSPFMPWSPLWGSRFFLFLYYHFFSLPPSWPLGSSLLHLGAGSWRREHTMVKSHPSPSWEFFSRGRGRMPIFFRSSLGFLGYLPEAPNLVSKIWYVRTFPNFGFQVLPNNYIDNPKQLRFKEYQLK